MVDVIGEAFVAIRPDVSGFQQQTESGVKSALASLVKGLGALWVGQKIGEGIRDTLTAGSDLNETISKTQAVFGEASGDAIKFGNNAAEALLEPRQAALEQLSTLGNLFTSLGIGRSKALDMGKGMVQLAADLGSFNNVPTDEALEAIRSGLVGETEPLRRFGVNMNEATLKAKAMELGISDGTAVLTPAQKAQAAYALILDQTKNAQGDVAKTGGNAAGQQKKLAARFDDLQATIGQKLIPVFNTLLGIGIQIVDWLKEHQTVAKALAVLVGGALVAAFVAWAASAASAAAATIIATAPVLAIIAAIGLVIAALILVWTKWDEIWGFIRDNPVIAVIVGILAAPIAAFVLLIAGLKMLYENWDEIWGWIKGVVKDAYDLVLKPIWDEMVNVFTVIGYALGVMKGVWDTVWQGVKDAVSGAWEFIKPILDQIIARVEDVIALKNKIVSFVTGSSGDINDVPEPQKSILKKLGYGATGGIVTKPTLSVIGEKGPEAVVPLSSMPGASPLPGGGWGQTWNISIQADSQTSAEKLIQRMFTASREEMILT